MFFLFRQRLLPKGEYSERCKAYKYSMSFCGGAVAFITLAKKELGLSLDANRELLLLTLAAWGIAIFAGFIVLNLSLREVWYWPEVREKWWLRRYHIDRVELGVLCLMMPIHLICVLVGVAGTAILVLKNL